MNETYIPASDLNKKKWYVIDCKGQQLGRISSYIVGLLSGKIKVLVLRNSAEPRATGILGKILQN